MLLSWPVYSARLLMLSHNEGSGQKKLSEQIELFKILKVWLRSEDNIVNTFHDYNVMYVNIIINPKLTRIHTGIDM